MLHLLPRTTLFPYTTLFPSNGSATSTATIATNTATPTGTFNTIIRGIGGGHTRAQTISLTGKPGAASDITVTATPLSRTVTQGQTASYAVTLQSLNGLAVNV